MDTSGVGHAQGASKHAVDGNTLQSRERWPAAAQRLVLQFCNVATDAKLPRSTEETIFQRRSVKASQFRCEAALGDGGKTPGATATLQAYATLEHSLCDDEVLRCQIRFTDLQSGGCPMPVGRRRFTD